MIEKDIWAEVANELTVPLWPHTGRVLRLSRNATYEGAKRGDIPTIEVGKLKRVATAWIRKTVGIDDVAQFTRRVAGISTEIAA